MTKTQTIITECQRARALQTLTALSAVLGGPSVPLIRQALDLDSSSSGSSKAQDYPPPTTNQIVTMTSPSIISCPQEEEGEEERPCLDPNSVMNLTRGQETVEYDDYNSCTTTTTTTTVSAVAPPPPPLLQPRPTVVRFSSDSPCVIEIPSHHDMDLHIIDCIWTSLEEIQHNAYRNTMEWKWDGKDWRQATEEDQMIYGYIHPATWEAMQLQRQREWLMVQKKRQEIMWREEWRFQLQHGTEQQDTRYCRSSRQRTQTKQREIMWRKGYGTPPSSSQRRRDVVPFLKQQKNDSAAPVRVRKDFITKKNKKVKKKEKKLQKQSLTGCNINFIKVLLRGVVAILFIFCQPILGN